MSHEGSKAKLIFYGILLVVLLFGFLSVFITFSGKFFSIELLMFILLLVLSFAGFIGYAKRWGERVLFFVFLLYIVNILFIWLFTDSLYVILVLVALVGFLLSIPKKVSSKKEVPLDEEPHSVVFDKPEPVEKTKPVVKSRSKSTKTTKTTKTTYSPGKFIASKYGNVYHLPKCDWAKRIGKTSRVWFKKKEDAWEKGYRAHSCVE